MSKTKAKNISNFKLFSIIAVLLFGGAIIMIASGLFDTPEIKEVQHNHTSIENKSSTNLAAINEINKLEEELTKNPNNHESLLRLGHLLNDNGFFEKAIAKYEKYLETHSDNVDVIVDMGVCYFELKQYDKSINVIKSALSINPKHQIANFNLGIVNFANNNLTEAKKWWALAKDINPTTNIGKKAEELLKSNN